LRRSGNCRTVLSTAALRALRTGNCGLRDYGTGTWEGGDESCDHVKTTQHREQPERPRGWDGSFRYTSEPQAIAYADVCGKCGARRADRQLGLEPTPDAYVAALVAVFAEVRRVLADDGTCFVNLGDSYIAGQGGRQSSIGEMPAGTLQRTNEPREREDVDTGAWGARDVTAKTTPARGTTDLKPKDLAGVPWMVAFALRADGWYLRSDIIWSKPNPMPESVTDRPTKAHEYVFLLSKRPRYWFDADAVREPHRWQDEELLRTNAQARQGARIAARRAEGDASVVRTQPSLDREKGRGKNGNHQSEFSASVAGRNIRSVWEMPEALVRLRGDLSEADRAYVLGELTKRGL
jgi:site-specific DNA-methyltransferase (cytosine-N4-specific)